MSISRFVVALVAGVAFSGIASAGPILSDLAVADYITVGNLDWAWAAPVTQQYFGGNQLFQASLHAGWREATDLEWAHRPKYTAFGHACASKYWNSAFVHCDFADILSQHWVAGTGWDARDLLYVRDDPPVNVPEPAMLALLGVGMLGLAVRRSVV